MPEDAKMVMPLDKREIRGLTLESVLKYGGIIVSIIVASYLLTGKVERNTARIDELEKEITVMQKEIDLLKDKDNTGDVWKAHTEEQLKRIK